jgi:hypothetical protein
VDYYIGLHGIMSAWLIAVIGFVYGYIAIEQFMKNEIPMSIIYAGYAFSNIGLFLTIK